MAIITLPKDISEMADEFTPVAEGTYEATIESVDIAKSSKGNDMLKVRWKIDNGGVVFDNVPLSVDFRVKQYAKLIGLESGDTLDTEQFIGARGIIEVKNRTYENANGETVTTADIKRITPIE